MRSNFVNCFYPNGCASPLPPITPTVGYGLRMQYTTATTGSQSVAAPVSGFSFPNEWLKLTRVGTTFTSWYSKDGVTWIKIGTTHVTMTNPVTIGLFVTSHNIGQTSSVAFDNVSVTPLP